MWCARDVFSRGVRHANNERTNERTDVQKTTATYANIERTVTTTTVVKENDKVEKSRSSTTFFLNNFLAFSLRVLVNSTKQNGRTFVYTYCGKISRRRVVCPCRCCCTRSRVYGARAVCENLSTANDRENDDHGDCDAGGGGDDDTGGQNR